MIKPDVLESPAADERERTPPTVTALLPAYNAGAFIERMLDSLVRQDYPALEVLISDDRSSDDTVAICRRFEAQHPNVSLHVQENNLGWLGNSNFLLKAAEGDIVFFAFHDDELLPTYVSEVVRALNSNPEAVLGYSDILLSFEGVSEPASFALMDGLTSAVERGRVMIERKENWWIPFRGLVRAAAYRDVGGLRSHRFGDRGSDWIWLLGLALRGPFVRVSKPLYLKNHRAHGVAAQWRPSRAVRVAMLGMCLREIMASPLSWPDRIRLAARAIAVRTPGMKRIVRRFHRLAPPSPRASDNS